MEDRRRAVSVGELNLSCSISIGRTTARSGTLGRSGWSETRRTEGNRSSRFLSLVPRVSWSRAGARARV